MRLKRWHLGGLAMVGLLAGAPAADQPQWGQAWNRNLVSAERSLPASFDPTNGTNLRWQVPLGTETHGTPIVAGGRIYIGTNNGRPRDERHKGDRGVLLCLDEKTGALLWQLIVPKRTEDIYLDWPNAGMCSPVTVEGDRVYVVNNRAEVLCLDAAGLANGNDGAFQDEARHATPADQEPIPVGPKDADILWLYNLETQAGIWPHDSAHSSIIIQGDLLYLNTGTGVDNTHRRIRTPEAPSLVGLHKKTGQLLAREVEMLATNIFHAAWSAPSMGRVGGSDQLWAAGGNGVIYAFAPLSAMPKPADKPIPLRKLWEFDFDPTAPKTNIHSFKTNRRESPSCIHGMTVFDGARLYAAGGGDLWWGKNAAWLKCVEPGEGARAPKEVWSYPLRKHVMSSPSISHGRVYIADCGGQFHCVDAATGKPLWTYDIQGEAWASPLVADGKVFLGTRGSQFYIFADAPEARLLAKVPLGKPISGTATAANGALYVATMTHLYSVAVR
jgi:outer membrane protein assembly factor BamB